MSILLGLLKKVIKEALCKSSPYFRSFLSKANLNQRNICGYSSFILLRFKHKANNYVWLQLNRQQEFNLNKRSMDLISQTCTVAPLLNVCSSLQI